ncbi:MAG: YCF48-related protein, partial [Phycisphaerae bacterium]
MKPPPSEKRARSKKTAKSKKKAARTPREGAGSGDGGSTTRGAAVGRDYRGWWFAASVVLFCGLTLLAVLQEPCLNAYSGVGAGSRGWGLTPIEFNAPKRLPRIRGNLNDVFALPDGRHVWAVGTGGLIVHTNDGGGTWEQQEVTPSTLPEPTAKPSTRPSQPEGKTVDPREQRTLPDAAPEEGVDTWPRNNAPVLGRRERFLMAPSKSAQRIPNRNASKQADPECISDKDCDDGDPCTINTCVQGQCRRSQRTCDDGNACTVDSCRSETEGGCVYEPVSCPQGEACDPATGECEPIVDNGPDTSTEPASTPAQTRPKGEGKFKTDLNAVYFLDPGHGWAVGDEGVIVTTENSGTSWSVRYREERGRILRDIAFVSESVGYAVGADGVVLGKENAGETWSSHEFPGLVVAWYVDEFAAWGWGMQSEVWRAGRPDWDWQRPAGVGLGKTVVNAFHFLNASYGWIAGFTVDTVREASNGTEPEIFGVILRTDDAGAKWTTLGDPEAPRLVDVFFSDKRTGWAVGCDGSIVHTDDGGETWTRQVSRTDEALGSVYFVDDSRGWVVGTNGTILATIDGGETWFHQTLRSDKELEAAGLETIGGGPYVRLPGVWYYFGLIGVLYCLFQATKRPEPVSSGEETIADMLASDRPLDPDDPDPLDLSSLAGGLARFLANPATDPPLTVAITGKWGTGKSSLMNLVKAKLDP